MRKYAPGKAIKAIVEAQMSLKDPFERDCLEELAERELRKLIRAGEFIPQEILHRTHSAVRWSNILIKLDWAEASILYGWVKRKKRG